MKHDIEMKPLNIFLSAYKHFSILNLSFILTFFKNWFYRKNKKKAVNCFGILIYNKYFQL